MLGEITDFEKANVIRRDLERIARRWREISAFGGSGAERPFSYLASIARTGKLPRLDDPLDTEAGASSPLGDDAPPGPGHVAR
jgi:hypothetical protein